MSGKTVRINNSGTAKDGVNAIACMGCHGRAEDANTVGFFGDGTGAGLRQHHFTSPDAGAAAACGGCHADANPANFTPASEDTMPPWYSSITNTSIGKIMNPCSPDGEEDFSSNGSGTDNDGDHAYDALEDSDCQIVAAGPFSAVIGLPDLDGSGSAEVGVLANDAATGDNVVQIRDGSTGLLVGTVNFGPDELFAIEVMDDLNGNGFPEIAVLGLRPTGHVRVHIRDSQTGVGVQTIFYGTAYAAVDMALMPDTDGNNTQEIAVLGKNASGGLRVQARDALSGSITSTTYFGTNMDPINVLVIPDISGNGMPEVVVNGRVIATGLGRAQLRDASTRIVIRNISFGSEYVPVELAVISDLSGDGAPDLAQLGRIEATGAVRVQIRATSDGAVISNAFLGTADLPVQVLGIGDANGDASADIAILVERSTGGGKVLIRDGSSGAAIRNTFVSKVNQPVGMALVEDLDASGNPELSVLGDSIDSAGTNRAQVKDSIEGTPLIEIDFP